VGGNHEAPRLSTTLNPLKLFEHIDKVHVVLEPQTVPIDGVDFVCVPAPSNFDEIASLFNPLLQTALSSSHSITKVLVAHLPLAQSRTSAERTMESFMGESVDVRQIPDDFVYVALGHVHKFQKIDFGTHPIYYSGSSERTDWSEEGEAKYIADIEINGKDAEIKPIELPVRSMKTLVDADCEGLSGAKITELVLKAAEAEKTSVSEALIRIKLESVDHNESRRIDWKEIEKALFGYGVFDFKPQARTTISLTQSIQAKGQYVFPPSKEFEFYISSRKEYSAIGKDLTRLAEEIIKEARERS
jgi:DNA repair exonuclease SbcCD nuclease subunit